MSEATRARPADWLPYKARDAFTLYELACLLNGRDPERVFEDARAEDHSRQAQERGIKGTGEPERPAYPFEPPEMLLVKLMGMPDWLLPADVCDVLKVLKKATGLPMQAPIPTKRARNLAAVLALPWPVELMHEPQAAPAATETPPTPASEPAAVNPPGKRWTPEALEELREYREANGTKEAALHFRISESRVRQLLPSESPPPKGYGAFNQRQ